jgi:zinc transport system substrate-binding protein
MKKYIFRLLPLLFCFISFGACSPGQEENVNQVQSELSKIGVFVSIPPQAYFVRRVGGDRVKVNILVEGGKSPHTYEPTPLQVVLLSEADVFFTVGVDYERAFIPRIERSLPNLQIVDTTAGIQFRSIEEDHDGGEDDHEDKDPHVWLGFNEVKIQAAHMRDALSAIDPEWTKVYSEGYKSFAADVDRIHGELSVALSSKRGKTLFVYHPTFGYFADSFGLIQRAVEIGGNAPSPKQIERIIEEAQTANAAAIIVQPQFSQAGANRIAEAVKAKVVSVDPLSENWILMMDDLARAVRESGDGG